MSRAFRPAVALHGGYVFRLRTFRALRNSELDFLPLGQRPETGSVDRTVMYEYVRAVFASNETEAFCFVEPLDATSIEIRHDALSLKNTIFFHIPGIEDALSWDA